MGERFEVIVDSFDGGMTNNPRDLRENVARVTKHLDNYTLPNSLQQHPDNDATSADRSATTFDNIRIRLFAYAKFLSTTRFFGLGVKTGGTVPTIFTKNDVADGSAWTEVNTTDDYSSLSTLDASQSLITGAPTVFHLYQRYLYGLDGDGWWKYGDLNDLGTATWTRQATGSFVASGSAPVYKLNIVPPITHSKDDIMYSAGGGGTLVANRIIRNNAAVWDNPLTFGTYDIVSSLCEFQDYLAIAVNNVSDTCNVYLWDRDSSLAAIDIKIDWGSGLLKFIDVVDGVLVGCTLEQPTGYAISPTVVFKYFNGTSAVEFARFNTTAATIYAYHQRYNSLVYFMAEMTIDGSVMRGIWKIAKTNQGLSVSFDRLPRLDDTITAGKLYGFLRTGDYFHIACGNVQDSDKFIVTKTGNTYGTTSYYQTIEHDCGDRTQTKKLVSFTATYEALPTAAGVIVTYRKDEESSFTQIFNDTTDNSTRHTAISVESSGAELPTFKTISFELRPANNAVITGYKFIYEIIPDDVV